MLSHYARHYKTGAPMPKALVEKIRKAAHFNQGYALGEIVAAAELDMKWHSLPATAPRQDVDKFESDALNSTGLDVAAVPPRYRSSYFLHIWSNGYSAGYYAYLWTEMLDQDVFSWFQEHGGLTRENGQRFRDMILSKDTPWITARCSAPSTAATRTSPRCWCIVGLFPNRANNYKPGGKT